MILQVLLNTQIIWMIFGKNNWEFESKLSSVRIGANESRKELSEIENISEFYKSWEKVIEFYNVQKAAYDSKNGKWLKILTPKQMLQRFSIALAQLKVGNTSKKLLKEIR